MSSLQAAFLATSGAVALAAALIAFFLTPQDATAPGRPWAAAGGSAVATAFNLGVLYTALDFAHGSPSADRIAWSVFGLACAAAAAVVGYFSAGSFTSTGTSGGTGTLTTISQATRVFRAAAAFTGAMAVIAFVVLVLS